MEGEIQLPTLPSGRRSSLEVGRAAIAAALRAAGSPQADAALHEPRWRQHYPRHVHRLVEACLRSSQAAHAAAEAGLDHLWHHLQWVGPEGARPMAAVRDAAVQAVGPGPFETVSVQGCGTRAPVPWTLPLGGRELGGQALRAQLDRWLQDGIIEPGAGTALTRCIDHPEWFDLSDQRFVLLGAGSEAGPLAWLMKWRAEVLAVDIPRPAVWQRMAVCAEAGNGRLHAPVLRQRPAGADWTAHAGADLLRQAPAVMAWLAGFEGPLHIAAHGYADGERHLRLALAMDWVQQLALQRPGSSLAWLATPTDAFAVPQDAALAARRAWAGRQPLMRGAQAALRLASCGQFFRPNGRHLYTSADGGRYGIVDSLIPQQGPNYALAKRLQQWRAVLARRQGLRVSLNIAPSTLTASVLKNRAFAAAFAGARQFGVEPFEPATTTALMAALWVHDLRCEQAAANPARPLLHPHELFMDTACHGGLWRIAYLPRSALPFAALPGMLGFGRSARA